MYIKKTTASTYEMMQMIICLQNLDGSIKSSSQLIVKESFPRIVSLIILIKYLLNIAEY